MMPEWHQLVCMSGHVKESETAKILQLYATSIFQVHSFVCQLDYVATRYLDSDSVVYNNSMSSEAKDNLAQIPELYQTKQGGSRTTSLACFRDHILLQSL